MHPVQVSSDACFTVRYSTRPDAGAEPIELSHQGEEYLLRTREVEYRGGGTPAKEVEAILVWDNAAKEYVLHFIQENLKVSRVLKRPALPTARVVMPASRGPGGEPDDSAHAPDHSPHAPNDPPHAPDSDSASDADDFGDFANELEGELGTIIGTAGPGGEEEEVSSEEE